MNQSAPLGTVVPVLVYDNVGDASHWLCTTFGFRERLRRSDDSGNVIVAQLVVGSGTIMLTPSRTGQGFDSDSATLRIPRPGELSHKVTVRVDGVDSHFERSKAGGARILSPPTTYAFGERQYTAEDFAGHRWTFSQSVVDVPPENWGAVRGPGYA